MYDFVLIEGRRVELCDECGFNRSELEMGDVGARLSNVRRLWSAALASDEAVLRARPAPATWCVIEYTSHSNFALRAIEWAAREFIQGRAPDWRLVPYASVPSDNATDDNHACEAIAIGDVHDRLEEATLSLASFAEGLSANEVGLTQDYGGGRYLTVGDVICHALHDAEHHALDIRRGVATLLIASAAHKGA